LKPPLGHSDLAGIKVGVFSVRAKLLPEVFESSGGHREDTSQRKGRGRQVFQEGGKHGSRRGAGDQAGKSAIGQRKLSNRESLS